MHIMMLIIHDSILREKFCSKQQGFCKWKPVLISTTKKSLLLEAEMIYRSSDKGHTASEAEVLHVLQLRGFISITKMVS